MATIERLVPTKELKTTHLLRAADQEQETWYMFYDSRSDDLILMLVPPTVETVAHYLDDYMALLYEPETLEVVGFQVDAFQHSFIEQHSSVENAWRLSETGVELEDIEDLMIVFERKKRAVAHELKNILLGKQNQSFHPVPA